MSNIKKLGDCIDLVLDYRGKTPKKMGSDWKDDGYRVISANNVHNGLLTDENEIRCVDEETYNKWMKNPVKKGDILLASEGATLGESLYWDSDEKIVLGQRLYAIRTNGKVLDAKYLSMYMRTDTFKSTISSMSTGSTVFGVSQKDLMNIEIIVPEIEVQREIGELKYLIDKKIITNNKLIEKLNNYIRSIYNQWFVQYEFPDEYGKPYKSLGGEFVEVSDFNYKIPKNWIIRNMLDLVKWEGTSQPPKSCFIYEPKDNYIRFIQNRDYSDGKHKTFIPVNKALGICNELDILMDKYGDAGRTRFGLSGAYNVALAKITPFDSNHREFLRCYLSSDYVYKYLHESSMASTRASLNENNISYLKVVIPPVYLLKKFNEITIPIVKEIINIKNQSEQLVNIHDYIMPLLMVEQVTI